MAKEDSNLTFNEWTVLLGVLLLVALYVIPQMMREYKIDKRRKAEELESRKNKKCEAPVENALAKEVTDAARDSIGYPMPSGKGVKDIIPDDEMINKYYVPAPDSIPIDYARKPVGACPHSKPMSMDLPIANVPLCVATSSADMRLHMI
jgi:hypothetical protein